VADHSFVVGSSWVDANGPNLTRFGHWSIEVPGALVELHCVYVLGDLPLSSYYLETGVVRIDAARHFRPVAQST
jgi:hypothetical protein